MRRGSEKENRATRKKIQGDCRDLETRQGMKSRKPLLDGIQKNLKRSELYKEPDFRRKNPWRGH